jgi:LytS/YehU family sensor histidine kinase
VRTAAGGSAIYTALPPGAYTFEVRAADMADAPVTRLALTIVPAYWQTTWFKALIGLLIVGALTFAVRTRLRNVRRQERLRSDFERRIGEVEMSALRAQMNPHFLFNSLNSINRYIVKHEPRIASEYLTKFSRLMRSVLNNSKEKLVPLKDDLDALLLYIDLESLRFTNRFELVSSIELEDDPGAIMVPPLLLQPYVENAIWHGLMHKKEGAPVLKVSIHQHKDALRCEVEDNGLGRAHAALLRSRSSIQRESMGTRITQDRLDLLKRLYNMDVSVVYTDLMDAAQRPLGTRVTLILQRQPST